MLFILPLFLTSVILLEILLLFSSSEVSSVFLGIIFALLFLYLDLDLSVASVDFIPSDE